MFAFLYHHAKQDEPDDRHPALEASLDVFDELLDYHRYRFNSKVQNSNGLEDSLKASPFYTYLDSLQQYLDHTEELRFFKSRVAINDGIMTLDSFQLMLDTSVLPLAKTLEEFEQRDEFYHNNVNWQRHKAKHYLSLFQAHFLKKHPVWSFYDSRIFSHRLVKEYAEVDGTAHLKISPKLWIHSGKNMELKLVLDKDTLIGNDEIHYQLPVSEAGDFMRDVELIERVVKTGRVTEYPLQLKYRVK